MVQRFVIQLLIGIVAVAAATSTAGATDVETVLYGESWESGSLDTSQWGAQCANLTPPYVGTRGSFRTQQKIVSQGRWGARFDLPADTAKPTACEVIHNRTLDLGRDDYYALAVLFPRNWREPGDQPNSFWGMGIAQFNYQLITGAPVGLAAHRNYVNLTILSGFFDGHRSQWYSGNGVGRGNLPRMYAIPSPLRRGVWHQLVVRVHWSTDSDGQVDVWHRLRGQRRWKRTVHFVGKPTVQWSITKPATSAMTTWDKFGAYRGPSASPISVWHDSFCRASTFRAAQSCL